MTLNVLETDNRGNLLEKPVVGWSVTTDRSITVNAAFEYEDSASVMRPHTEKIQLGLTPQQALQLAKGLTDIAKGILRGWSENQGSSE